jgi:hypothetical protein
MLEAEETCGHNISKRGCLSVYFPDEGLVQVVMFAEMDHLPCLTSLYAYAVHDDGALLGITVAGHLRNKWANRDSHSTGIAIMLELAPQLLALSFLHCKNVIVKTDSPSQRQQKRRVKDGRMPMVAFHTLVIKPMQTILQHEGEIGAVGLARALHICRGHFKDFTKGRGLFGRSKGLYWWDPQVRGSLSKGLTLKDYRVKSV